jgi:hypothetical protein
MYAFGLVLAIPVCLVMIGAVELAIGSTFAGPVSLSHVNLASSAWLAAIFGIGGFLVALSATWALVRDQPLRGEAT